MLCAGTASAEIFRSTKGQGGNLNMHLPLVYYFLHLCIFYILNNLGDCTSLFNCQAGLTCYFGRCQPAW